MPVLSLSKWPDMVGIAHPTDAIEPVKKLTAFIGIQLLDKAW